MRVTDIETRATGVERAWAVFVPRAILGFVYVFAGLHKLMDTGATAFGALAAAQPDLARFLPAPLLVLSGTLTPFIELALGVLILAGLWTPSALRCLAVLLVSVTMAWGVAGLLHPVGATAMNTSVVNFYILPRAALLILVLYLPRADDLLSVDALLARPTTDPRSLDA